MTTRPEQLTLSWPSPAAMGRDDFLETPSNAVALAAVSRPDLPGGVLVVSGPEGAGKTHLAAIWTAETGAAWIPAESLADALPRLIAGNTPGAVTLDDADRALAADPRAPEALFHLLNHLRGRGQLLLTACTPARDWPLTLPDLRSRLNAAAHVALDHPDEALLAAVLVKQFADRQIHVDPRVIDFAVARMERSLSAARELVEALDARALSQGRPITRSLAAQVLDALDITGPRDASSPD